LLGFVFLTLIFFCPLQVAAFFAGVDQGSGKLAVQQSLESIDANIKWIKQHGPKVNAWIERFLRSEHQPGNNHFKHPTYYDEVMMEKYGRP